MLEKPQWLSPESARSDGRLYYLIFDNGKANKDQFEKTYFRSKDGGWYCLSPMQKARSEPIAVIPV